MNFQVSHFTEPESGSMISQNGRGMLNSFGHPVWSRGRCVGRVCGECVVGVWCVYGVCMVSVWLVCGVCTVRVCVV